MEFLRLHAYAVEPSRTTGLEAVPIGGSLPITRPLTRVLNRSIVSASFETRTRVAFRVDPETRTNEIRDLVINYGFGDDQAATDAANTLAERLAGSMDQRSRPGLFIAAAVEDDPSRTVYLWVFPRDQAFRFRSGAKGPTIQVLTDVFSQTSDLRKAARFQGRNLRNEFIVGRVLDLQVRQKPKIAADFWINDFLMCGFGTLGDSGTTLVARAFQTAFAACDDPEDQEGLFAAMIALRRARRRNWSATDIADRYLSGKGKETFQASIDDDLARTATFEFQTDAFDKALSFRVFQLESGVFVSAPFGEVGRSVVIDRGAEDGAANRLSCEGSIVAEKVKRQPS